jgi:hypothetical protein
MHYALLTITSRKNMHTMLYVTIKNHLAKLLSKMECGLVLQRHTSKNWRRVMAAVLACVSTTALLVPFSTPVSAITGTWTPYVPSTGTLGSAWRSVTFGNGMFVAVASNGTNRVMTSPDGITWTARTAAGDIQWLSVTFGNGVFVAVGDTVTSGVSRVMTSTNGIDWTPREATWDSQWRSVTFGNGVFVAVASDGTNRVMTSEDGSSWTARTAAEAISWNSVTFGNGVFVAVAFNGTNRVMTSEDGSSWTARTAAVANSWNSVTFGNGVFVAVAFDGTNRVMTSENGITWTQPSDVAPADVWYSVGYGGGVFIALAFNSTQVMISSDNGATWTTNTTVASAIWNSVTYSNGVFVAVNENGTNRVARLDLRPSTPVTTNLQCIHATTLVDVAVSNVGGSPIINYEYHISTSFPASQPTVWTAFSPAQNTTPLEWDMQALGYPAGVLHYYYVRAVNSFGASIGSWRSNIQESCTNSFRTSTTTSTTTTTTTTTPPPTTTIALSTPSVVTRDTSVSQVQSALPITGLDAKQGLAIVVLFWMFGVGVITKVRRYYHGPA